MEDIKALLQRRRPEEPPEIQAIKQYIQETFHAPSKVGIQGDAIVVTVSSAAFANTLRYHITKLQQAANTTRRITLRIG
jgi:hypothetical protein